MREEMRMEIEIGFGSKDGFWFLRNLGFNGFRKSRIRMREEMRMEIEIEVKF
nr:MAG TPA: hypothetical protein [Caudoviricetes sp.]